MMGYMWEGNGGMRGGHPLHLAGRGDQTQLETRSLSGPLWPSGGLLAKSPRQTQALANGTTSVPALPAQGSTVLSSEACTTASQGWEVCQVQTMSPLPCPVSPMPCPMPPPPHQVPDLWDLSTLQACGQHPRALQLLCPLVGLPPFPEALVEASLRLVACAGQGPSVGSSCID